MGQLFTIYLAKSKELKINPMSLCLVRPSLRTCWGLELSYRQDPHSGDSGHLELCVAKVLQGAPASQVLQQGDIIRHINDWDVTRFHDPEVAAHLFCAAGNMIKLRIDRDNQFHDNKTNCQNWAPLISL